MLRTELLEFCLRAPFELVHSGIWFHSRVFGAGSALICPKIKANGRGAGSVKVNTNGRAADLEIDCVLFDDRLEYA